MCAQEPAVRLESLMPVPKTRIEQNFSDEEDLDHLTKVRENATVEHADGVAFGD